MKERRNKPLPKEDPDYRTPERNVPPPSPKENPTKGVSDDIGTAISALGLANPLRSDGVGSVTVVVELGPETLRLLTDIQTDIKRLADHFDPLPPDIVDTPFIAQRLGCTTTWIAQMVRSDEIPKGCIVPGSGKGRQWKFYRRRIEDWLASR